jgi:hypothetical protein
MFLRIGYREGELASTSQILSDIGKITPNLSPTRSPSPLYHLRDSGELAPVDKLSFPRYNRRSLRTMPHVNLSGPTRS